MVPEKIEGKNEKKTTSERKLCKNPSSGGDRGAGDREKRGREVYGRREKRGREAGFPRWREAGEKGKNYATLRNISNRKIAKGREPKNTGREPGLKGTGSGRFEPPCPPPTFKKPSKTLRTLSRRRLLLPLKTSYT